MHLQMASMVKSEEGRGEDKESGSGLRWTIPCSLHHLFLTSSSILVISPALMLFSSRPRCLSGNSSLHSNAPMMSFPPRSLMPFPSRSTCLRLLFSFSTSASSLAPGSPNLFSSRMMWISDLFPLRLSKSSFQAARSALLVCASPKYWRWECCLIYDAISFTPLLPKPFPPMSSSNRAKTLRELHPVGSCRGAVCCADGSSDCWMAAAALIVCSCISAIPVNRVSTPWSRSLFPNRLWRKVKGTALRFEFLHHFLIFLKARCPWSMQILKKQTNKEKKETLLSICPPPPYVFHCCVAQRESKKSVSVICMHNCWF